MAFAIYGKPSCPECREPLAPKAMAFSCGSCGHRIEPVQSCGRSRSWGCLAGFALLMIAMGTVADFESSRFRDKIRHDLGEQIQACVVRNRQLEIQLAAARAATRDAEARESCARARIEALREALTQTARGRCAANAGDGQLIDNLLHKMVEATGDAPLDAEQSRAFEARIYSIAREGLPPASIRK